MTYEYRCETCEKITEKKMPITDDHPDVVECDHCKTMTAKRVFSMAIHIPDSFKAVGGDPAWANRHGKFPPGVRGKYTRGGGVSG
jgi:putative FmdB family regulatory protein